MTVLAALAVELADELAGGTQSAAMPLIRAGLRLSYGQIGLLAAVPLTAGSLIELPMGLLAGQGRRRWRFAVGGGLVFTGALLGAAMAGTFGILLAAFVVFFPASGAFVSLTQANLVDAAPGRQEQLLARWTLAGAAGAVAGPLLLSAVVAAGGSWRTAYLILSGVAALAWLGLAVAGPAVPVPVPVPDTGGTAAPRPDGRPGGLRQALALLRDAPVARWLILLQVADLLLDVLTGFSALYLVAATGVSPAQAALGVGVRLAADLAGSACLIPVLERFSGRAVLRASATAALALYPAFLLVPGFWVKVGILAALSMITAAWYPILQAELYRALPGRSDVAVSLLSAAGLVAGAGPLAVGFLAERAGLSHAMLVLAVAPAGLLLTLAWPRRGPGGRRGRRD